MNINTLITGALAHDFVWVFSFYDLFFVCFCFSLVFVFVGNLPGFRLKACLRVTAKASGETGGFVGPSMPYGPVGS